MLSKAMRGTVTRWGTRGYGFVRPDDTDIDAWVHFRFLAEPNWVPSTGERVEFELKELPDGRYQAWFLRPARQTLPPGPPVEGTGDAGTATPGSGLGPPAGSRSLGTLGEALVRAGIARVEASDAASAAPTAEPATAPPAVLPAPVTKLQDRLALHRAAAEQKSATLRAEAETFRQRIAELEAKAGQVALRLEEHQAQVLQEESSLVASAVSTVADEFERALGERRRLLDSIRPLREDAVARLGRQPVEEYEAIRRRLGPDVEGRDELERRAYQALEREMRPSLVELAAGMDALDALAPPNVRFTLFVAGTDAPSAIFVSPLHGRRAPTEDNLDDVVDDIRWRVGCVFWQTVERAACELGAGGGATEYGTVAGSLAARLGGCDPDLFGILLDEAWACRPFLEQANVDFGFDVVSGLAPRFEPEAPNSAEAERAPCAEKNCKGGALPEVALRLGLSIRDLVVALQHFGLPPADDTVEPGAEASLRLLVGVADQLALPEAGAEPAEPAPAGEPPSGPRAAAGRLLAKLLRDRRIGGRHTGIEHVYGHHFADEEKHVARRIVEFFERDGLLITKYNEGAHHVSVNPRRLREVGEIIGRTWSRMAEIDAL